MINKTIFDLNSSSIDVVTAGLNEQGNPELDIGLARLTNDNSSEDLKLNGKNILTGENVALFGEGAPTVSTAAEFIGQIYINTIDESVYMCTNIVTVDNVTTYSWSNSLPVTIDYTR